MAGIYPPEKRMEELSARLSAREQESIDALASAAFERSRTKGLS